HQRTWNAGSRRTVNRPPPAPEQDLRAAAVSLIREVVALAEREIGEELPRLRAGNRVEEDAERDPRQKQHRVSRAVVLLSLDASGRFGQLVERFSQPVLDVLVRCDTRGDRNRAAAADELVVDLTRGLERVAHVLTELLVRQRALDVRTCAPGPLQQPVSRLCHSPVVLSLGVSPARYRGKSLQTH